MGRCELLHSTVALALFEVPIYNLRKTSRSANRWPLISLSLPAGPGIMISVDYFGHLPVTPSVNTYRYATLLTNRYSHRTGMLVVNATKLWPKPTANVFINRHTTLFESTSEAHTPITVFSFAIQALARCVCTRDTRGVRKIVMSF